MENKMRTTDLDKIEKFDTHSHIGIDAHNNTPGDIGNYMNAAHQKNVRRAIIMPVPNPRYSTESGTYTPLNWESEGMRFRTLSQLERPNGIIRGPVPENPFAEINERMERVVRRRSCPEFELYFVPLVHPIFDTQYHVDQTLERKPLAIKVKGSAWGFKPVEIPRSFFESLKRYDVPLIVHTDYSDGPTAGDHVYNGAQDPLTWISILERNGVRASLAHGLRLDEASWDRVRESGDQFIVGFGPRLNTKGHRVVKKGGNYVDDLIGMADLKRLTYDLDFPWNKDESGSIEWDLDHELLGKMPKESLHDFYHGNAERFYRLKSTSSLDE